MKQFPSCSWGFGMFLHWMLSPYTRPWSSCCEAWFLAAGLCAAMRVQTSNHRAPVVLHLQQAILLLIGSKTQDACRQLVVVLLSFEIGTHWQLGRPSTIG